MTDTTPLVTWPDSEGLVREEEIDVSDQERVKLVRNHNAVKLEVPVDD